MGRGEASASPALFQSKGIQKPGMAAHDSKPSTVGGRGGRVINASSAQPGQSWQFSEIMPQIKK